MDYRYEIQKESSFAQETTLLLIHKSWRLCPGKQIPLLGTIWLTRRCLWRYRLLVWSWVMVNYVYRMNIVAWLVERYFASGFPILLPVGWVMHISFFWLKISRKADKGWGWHLFSGRLKSDLLVIDNLWFDCCARNTWTVRYVDPFFFFFIDLPVGSSSAWTSEFLAITASRNVADFVFHRAATDEV